MSGLTGLELVGTGLSALLSLTPEAFLLLLRVSIVLSDSSFCSSGFSSAHLGGSFFAAALDEAADTLTLLCEIN